MSERSERLFELLREVNRGIGKRIKDLLAEQGLPMIMMMTAKQIELEPGITISELARRTDIAKSHISNTIRELEKREWVEKRADVNDQRLVRLYLTDKAADDLRLIRGGIRQQLNQLVISIPEERLDDLVKGLEDIKGLVITHGDREAHGAIKPGRPRKGT